MLVIKKINNNVAICRDSKQHELIAFGKGIGFPEIPYELEDLSIIRRTYYGVDDNYLNLIHSVPEEIFEVASEVVDLAIAKIDSELSPNIVFTLADHIHFAVERIRKNINISNPLQYEVQHMYETEYEIGMQAIQLMKKRLNVFFPKAEATNLALHLVNAQEKLMTSADQVNSEEILHDITDLISQHFNMYIDKNSFNYARFVSHIQYLLKRKEAKQSIDTLNKKMFESMIEEYPKTYTCVGKISDYLADSIDWTLSQEEELYLMLHVNRLCVREDAE
ncbi:transcriptional regulator [Enterococcus florum]|uniref:Transcriptional regulator n=1 Tax=Enterococcus florum TaxID=2480627 RepID=A0A4P5PGQ9_9ENTE|nr:PRD domain-containing protein [Enterococcus florum]GCF94842.1 transcriptional regulator [Enterococcus florum]